ncbi:MAG: ecfA1 [Oscillospiraceae bacterium]|jgi:energy-coupling factor transport system ATP-binding protein|nr:ecfA1 [Oscillospiraceae bacterium]
MRGRANEAIGGIKLPAIIRTEGLTHVYSEGTPFRKVAVGNINLEIEQGGFVGVIGHTGSGKSTLIQHFNGLLKPTSGKIFVDGVDIWENKQDMRKVRFDVGLVFQYPEYQLFEETVYKDIAFGPKNMGLSEDEVDKRVHDAVRFVGVSQDLLEKSPFELSGGQKRRVAIAGVIAMEPKVLILDEPTAGLDPKGRDKILSQIKEYHEQQQNTVLLVSHSMEDVAKFASSVLVMNNAGIYAHDSIQNVFSRVDELEKMGLSAPQITKVFYKLKQKGFPVDSDVFSVKDAKNQLQKMLSRGDSGKC